MQHHIPLEVLGPAGAPMANAVQACVHCGFCLPACPTYQVLGSEMDSPRGRIYLMKSVLEGQIDLEQAMTHVDRCLGCLACETACPSGVVYRDLLSPFREHAEQKRRQSIVRRMRRWLMVRTLVNPAFFRVTARLGTFVRPLQRWLPEQMRESLALLPASLPARVVLPPLRPALGTRRARVALLAGCVQQVLEPEINLATIDVLSRNGVEVIVPPEQACCGALPWHIGDGASARRLARINLRAFPADVDAIISNAAGCGSGLHEYPMMFVGQSEEPEAQQFSRRVVDVSVFLEQLGLVTPPALAMPTRVAYHDACHLRHAQGVSGAPRRLLASIGNLTLCEIPDGDICCGSAGTYNLDQPTIAADLGQRKARNILSTQPQLVVAGNIGCLMQIRRYLNGLPNPPQVMHTMQLLHQAYIGTVSTVSTPLRLQVQE